MKIDMSINTTSWGYCCEFVSEVLKENNILSSPKNPQQMRPIELMNIENSIDVYEGTVMNYSSSVTSYREAMVMSHG